ncbi:hypothetical protein GN956_G9066 [Arapaima gigas]
MLSAPRRQNSAAYRLPVQRSRYRPAAGPRPGSREGKRRAGRGRKVGSSFPAAAPRGIRRGGSKTERRWRIFPSSPALSASRTHLLHDMEEPALRTAPAVGPKEAAAASQITCESAPQDRPVSPVSSCVSMRSDQSVPLIINFKEGETPAGHSAPQDRPVSPVSSCVSMRSSQSVPLIINFKEGETPAGHSTPQERSGSPVEAGVLVKTRQLMSGSEGESEVFSHPSHLKSKCMEFDTEVC